MTNEIQTQIEAMKKWCMDNYCNGADTMVECWDDSNYEDLFKPSEYDPTQTAPTVEEAWQTLRDIAGIYEERQADARNSAFWAS